MCRAGDNRNVGWRPGVAVPGTSLGKGSLLLAALLVWMPTALAEEGSTPLECSIGVPCEPVDVCVSGPSCAVSVCGPVLCDVGVSYGYQCTRQADIEGETCQRSVASRATVSVAQVRLVESNAGVALTDGGVQMLNLRNTWFSHAVQANTRVVGHDTGTVSALVYRSDIETSNGNQATQLGAGVSHSEGSFPETGFDVLAGVVLMDDKPSGCFVRETSTTSVECPRGVLLLSN